VVVELGGGNDGLSMVVPIADPAYRALRPTLAVADAIALDATVGLHPKLVKLADRYRAGQVAIVEGVGYPDPNLSHFASLGYWWSGKPGESGGAGWLGRYLDGAVGFEDPLAAIGIGPVPSPALLGDRSSPPPSPTPRLSRPPRPGSTPRDLMAAWGRFAPASPDPVTLFGQVQEAIGLSVRAGPSSTPTSPLRRHREPDRRALPRQTGRLGSAVTDSLQLAAQLVVAKHAPRVIYVSGLGDYDTHQGQAQRHPALMSDLDAGLDTFFHTLDARTQLTARW